MWPLPGVQGAQGGPDRRHVPGGHGPAQAQEELRGVRRRVRHVLGLGLGLGLGMPGRSDTHEEGMRKGEPLRPLDQACGRRQRAMTGALTLALTLALTVGNAGGAAAAGGPRAGRPLRHDPDTSPNPNPESWTSTLTLPCRPTVPQGGDGGAAAARGQRGGRLRQAGRVHRPRGD